MHKKNKQSNIAAFSRNQTCYHHFDQVCRLQRQVSFVVWIVLLTNNPLPSPHPTLTKSNKKTKMHFSHVNFFHFVDRSWGYKHNCKWYLEYITSNCPDSSTIWSPPSSDQPEQLASGCIVIFHKYCCFTKHVGIATNLTVRNPWVYITDRFLSNYQNADIYGAWIKICCILKWILF